MSSQTAGAKLIMFIVLVCVGFLLGSLASVLPLIMEGHSIEDITANPSIAYESSAGTIRFSLFLNHLFFFLLPSLVYIIIYYGKNFRNELDISKAPSLKLSVLAILFLFCCLPIVNFVHHLNSLLPLADWMKETEANVAEMLNKIIISDNKFVLILNILLISVMPAIGEELVFRGITQKNLEKIIGNGHAAVWISAFLFSAIHMQFEGFFARMFLGAVLGYSYLWTRNFWVPVLLHFVNNLMPLLALAVLDIDLTENNVETNEGFSYFWLLASFVGLTILYKLFKIYNGERKLS